MRNLRLLFIVIGLVVLHSTAYAGNRAGAVTMTLGAGQDYFAEHRHIDNTGFPFVALGYDLTEHWGVEALAAVFSTDSRRLEDNGEQIKGTLFSFNGLYHFSSFYKFEPYILAGVGIIGMHPNGVHSHFVGSLN